MHVPLLMVPGQPIPLPVIPPKNINFLFWLPLSCLAYYIEFDYNYGIIEHGCGEIDYG